MYRDCSEFGVETSILVAPALKLLIKEIDVKRPSEEGRELVPADQNFPRSVNVALRGSPYQLYHWLVPIVW